MITEDYVSFETAKLLKEKGFDEGCRALYGTAGSFSYKKYEVEASECEMHNAILAPTLQMAMKWIQEIHNIIIVADYEYEFTDTSWYFKIYRLGENGKPERVPVKGVAYDNSGEHIVGYRDYERSYKDYATKEEAIEEGIEYCLENLI